MSANPKVAAKDTAVNKAIQPDSAPASAPPPAPESPPEKHGKRRKKKNRNIPTLNDERIAEERHLALKMANTLSGQMAIMFVDNNSDMVAVPINLYNKSGKVVLGIERSPLDVVWGAKLGRWAEPVMSPVGQTYPHGMFALVPVIKVFISQYFESKHEATQSNSKRVLVVRNGIGDIILAAKQRTNTKIRFVYGHCRQVDLKLYDAFKREVLFCRQLMRFTSTMCCLLLQCMDVFVQPGKLAGRVRQRWTLCSNHFVVEDNREKVLYLVRQRERQTFEILSITQKLIGLISPSLIEEKAKSTKELPLLSLEISQQSLNPVDKALLIGTAFLIKHLFYDK